MGLLMQELTLGCSARTWRSGKKMPHIRTGNWRNTGVKDGQRWQKHTVLHACGCYLPTLGAFFAAPHAVLFLVSASSLDVCDKGCAGLKHKLCHVVWVDLAQRRTWGFTGGFCLQ